MEELMMMIQQDPELWEIVEKIKDEDVDLQFFLDDVSHWKKHKPVCRAAVAALAHRAHRQRVARAVREKDNVEEGVKQEDKLCVICQNRPKAPVQVCAGGLEKFTSRPTEEHILRLFK